MNDAISALNFLNKGGMAMKIKLTVFLMVLGFVLPGLLPAAEIITEEDIIKRVVVEEDFIKRRTTFSFCSIRPHRWLSMLIREPK